jgi:aerobic C4-dicarboxylate transport protein
MADGPDLRFAQAGRFSVARFVWRNLYVQVLIAIFLAILLGHFYPGVAVMMKPFGDGFIKLIKMVIGLIIFFTVVSGISGMQHVGKVGRVGGLAILYFEVVSTLALAIGLVVGNVLQPGASFHASVASLDAASVRQYVSVAHDHGVVEFLLSVIPNTLLGAFTHDDILPVVFVSVLLGVVLARMGERGKPIKELVDACTHWIFDAINIIMRAAPLGAFGAMAFTVGRFGIGSLQSLLYLIAAFYLSSGLFVVFVLGSIGWACGFNIFRILGYIKEELLLVLGTSSSDAALPALMEKLEKLGCGKTIVGLVMPAGYVFNSDGTNIYLTMAILFIAQATHVELSIGQQLAILGVATLTSKGSAGVTGAGFVSLVATLALVPSIPVIGVALLLGIDRVISEGRALVNVIGNVVATLVIAKRERELDFASMSRVLEIGPARVSRDNK